MRYRAKNTVVSFSVCAVAAFLLRCSGNPTMAGGVETTNGLTIIASGLTVHGSAPAGSKVSIFADSFNPAPNYRKAFSDSASVDSGETFSFKQIGDSGAYNVIAINPLARRGAMFPSLYLRPDEYDSIFIPFDTLGEISGVTLTINNSDTTAFGFNDVYCKGTNFFTRSDSSGYYKMSNIPLGKYRVALVIQVALATVGPPEYEIEQAAELNEKNLIVDLDFFVK